MQPLHQHEIEVARLKKLTYWTRGDLNLAKTLRGQIKGEIRRWSEMASRWNAPQQIAECARKSQAFCSLALELDSLIAKGEAQQLRTDALCKRGENSADYIPLYR